MTRLDSVPAIAAERDRLKSLGVTAVGLRLSATSWERLRMAIGVFAAPGRLKLTPDDVPAREVLGLPVEVVGDELTDAVLCVPYDSWRSAVCGWCRRVWRARRRESLA